MARVFQRMVFSNINNQDRRYVADRGVLLATTGRFAIPPDITPDQAEQIATAAGANVNVDFDSVCPEGAFKMRKLVFIRQSGNSLSVPIGNRQNLITARNAIRGILNSQANNQVVCIRLVGEEFDAMNDELGVAWDGQAVATSSRPDNGSKQFVYSGSIRYRTDTAPGGNVVITTSVKVDTENEGNPPACLGNVWEECAGELVPARLNCGGTNREHRRYLLDFAVREGENQENVEGDNTPLSAQRKELPVSAWAASEILQCGQNAAELTGLFCISYRGESFARFHTIA